MAATWFVAGVVPWVLVAASGLAADTRSASLHLPSSFSHVVFSDFDGDNWQDKASLHSKGTSKTIQVRLSDSASYSLSFHSPEATTGRLLTCDLDQDHDQDLLWVSQETPHTILYWLGNGSGGFTSNPDFQPDSLQLNALLDDGTGDQLSPESLTEEDATPDLVTEDDSLPATTLRKTLLSQVQKPLCTPVILHLSASVESLPRKRGPPSLFPC